MHARCGMSVFCSLAAAASLLAWLARAAVHVSGWPVFRSSRATQRCTMRFMRARSLRYARGYSSVQQCSASARLFQAQATTSSAVCQAGFALFRRCGLTIRSSGLPMSVCAKIVRRRRQPLNSSVRPHKRFLFSVHSLRHVGFCSQAAVASLLAWLACAVVHVSGW